MFFVSQDCRGWLDYSLYLPSKIGIMEMGTVMGTEMLMVVALDGGMDLSVISKMEEKRSKVCFWTGPLGFRVLLGVTIVLGLGVGVDSGSWTS